MSSHTKPPQRGTLLFAKTGMLLTVLSSEPDNTRVWELIPNRGEGSIGDHILGIFQHVDPEEWL